MNKIGEEMLKCVSIKTNIEYWFREDGTCFKFNQDNFTLTIEKANTVIELSCTELEDIIERLKEMGIVNE